MSNIDVKAVVLYCGYAESARVAPLILFKQHNRPYTQVEAVRSVARHLLAKYLDHHPNRTLANFDPWAFAVWLHTVAGGTADDYGCDDGTDDWWEYDGMNELLRLKPTEVVEIAERAEEVITLALEGLTGEAEHKQSQYVVEAAEERVRLSGDSINVDVALMISERAKLVSEKSSKFY